MDLFNLFGENDRCRCMHMRWTLARRQWRHRTSTRQITTIALCAKPFTHHLHCSHLYRGRPSVRHNLCVIFLSHHFHIIISIYTYHFAIHTKCHTIRGVNAMTWLFSTRMWIDLVLPWKRFLFFTLCGRQNVNVLIFCRRNHKTNYKLTLLLRRAVFSFLFFLLSQFTNVFCCFCVVCDGGSCTARMCRLGNRLPQTAKIREIFVYLLEMAAAAATTAAAGATTTRRIHRVNFISITNTRMRGVRFVTIF